MSRWQTDLSAPLPLGHHKAIETALKLRTENPTVYSYPTLADLMSRYHGFTRTEGWWLKTLREHGAPYKLPQEACERARNLRARGYLKMAA